VGLIAVTLSCRPWEDQVTAVYRMGLEWATFAVRDPNVRVASCINFTNFTVGFLPPACKCVKDLVNAIYLSRNLALVKTQGPSPGQTPSPDVPIMDLFRK
jgi:hypothetical protein